MKTKNELKKQLENMGIHITGNYVKKSDITKVLAKHSVVTITLEFDHKPTQQDIYDYLKELMEDESLDYEVK
jgi:hypothetical protein